MRVHPTHAEDTAHRTCHYAGDQAWSRTGPPISDATRRRARSRCFGGEGPGLSHVTTVRRCSDGFASTRPTGAKGQAENVCDIPAGAHQRVAERKQERAQPGPVARGDHPDQLPVDGRVTGPSLTGVAAPADREAESISRTVTTTPPASPTPTTLTHSRSAFTRRPASRRPGRCPRAGLLRAPSRPVGGANHAGSGRGQRRTGTRRTGPTAP